MAALADDGDPVSSGILDQTARRIAVAIVTIVSLLDLDCVVLGGPYWTPASRFLLERLPTLINSSSALITTHPVTVTQSAIGDDLAAVGAACLVLDNALSPRASTLVISI